MMSTRKRIVKKDVEFEFVQKFIDKLLYSNKRHKIIVGGRAKTASWSIAQAVLIEGMKRECFVLCIREVQKTLKDSVKKLLSDTIKRKGLDFFYTVKETEIVGINGTRIIFNGMHDYNADNIKSLEGVDICWVAESQSLSRESVNMLRPTIRKDPDPITGAPGSTFWWDFNPRYETDPVWIDYIVNNDPNAEVLWLNWRDNPWFPKSLLLEKDSDYRRNTKEADHIWEGHLRSTGDTFVCPSELVDIALRKHISHPKGIIVVGADIAHQGGDKIIFYKRHGNKIIASYESRFQDTPTTIAHLKAFMVDRSVILNIDNGHVGAAVADFMIRAGYIVNRINFGGVPKDTEHYKDVATEMYFGLRDRLEFIDIPKDNELRNQLIQRKYYFISDEVMKIESKKDFKKHATMESRSPDKADALVLTFYSPVLGECAVATIEHNPY